MNKLFSKGALAAATAVVLFGAGIVLGDTNGSGSECSCSSTQDGDLSMDAGCPDGQTCSASCFDVSTGEVEFFLYCCTSTTSCSETTITGEDANHGSCTDWTCSGP